MMFFPIFFPFIVFSILLSVEAKGQNPGQSSKQPMWGLQKTMGTHVGQRDTLKAKAWIEKLVAEQRNGVPYAENCAWVYPQVNAAPGFEKVSYRLREGCCISFKNGKIIRFLFHSSHADPEVGDVILAIDEGGKVFVNFSHICGGIVHFEYMKKEYGKQQLPVVPVDPDQFFENFVCDTDGQAWQLLLEN